MKKKIIEIEKAKYESDINTSQWYVDNLLKEFPDSAPFVNKELKRLAKREYNKEYFGRALYYAEFAMDEKIIRKSAEKLASKYLQREEFNDAKRIFDNYPTARNTIKQEYEALFSRLTNGKDKDIRKAINLAVGFNDERYDSLVESRLEEEIIQGRIKDAKISVDNHSNLSRYKDLVYQLYEQMEKK